MFGKGSEYGSGHGDLTDRANVLFWKPSVFIVLPIIQNQSKTKTIAHTVFQTFINNSSRYKTQKAPWWVLSAGDDRNIRKSYFITNRYWNLNLSKVALSSVTKCSP